MLKVEEFIVSKNYGLIKYNCEIEFNCLKEKKIMVFGVILFFFLFGVRYVF